MDFIILAKFNLLSENAFNMVKAKILLFGKESSLSFPNNKSLDTSELESFADNKLNLNLVEMLISVFHVAKNIMATEENAGNQ